MTRWMTGLFALAALAAGAQTKPNILHIHADDHRADGLSALGHPVLQTPHLDKLVGRGTTFTHCYTMGSMIGAVCLPSRTMMLTGRSLFRIPGNRGGGEAVEPGALLPRVMASAGYQTFHVGKGGNEFKPGIEAFERNVVLDDRGPELRRGSSGRHADAVIAFLGGRDKAKPFYVYLAPPVPHDPRAAEPEFHKLYDPDQIPLPASFLPLHPFDNGDMTVRDEQLAPWPRTGADTRRQLADYYACVSGLDHHVGRIIETLRTRGLLDHTIIVFSGDNGLSLGGHGLFGKQNLYEFGGMHVPLVIAGPGIPRGRSDALVYLMDLFPTFCEFGGAKIPDRVEGRSLVPVLAGREAGVRDTLYTAYQNGQRAVRDGRWKLIRYPVVNVTQLFDLQNDPHELTNLADQSGHGERVKELTGKLEAAMKDHADPVPLVVANPKPAAWTPPAGATGKQRVRAAK